MILSICSNGDVLKVLRIVKIVIEIICISVPVFLLVTGSLTYLNAMKSKDIDIAGSNKIIIRKVIASILVFLVPLFVSIILNIASNGDNNYKECLDMATPDGIKSAYKSKARESIDKAKSSMNRNDYANAAIEVSKTDDDNLRKELNELDYYIDISEAIDNLKNNYNEEDKKKIIDAINKINNSEIKNKLLDKLNGINNIEVADDPSIDNTKFVPGMHKYKHTNGMIYKLYIPENLPEHKKIPLIVSMHGGYGTPNCSKSDGFVSYQWPIRNHNKDGFKIETDAIIVAPQNQTCNWDSSVDKASEIIRYVIKNYNIDTNRIAIMGSSQGGAGTFELLYDDPNTNSDDDMASMFSVALILSSANTNKDRLKKMNTDTPIWFIYSSKEYQKVIDYARELQELWKDRNFRTTALINVGHETGEPVFKYTDMFNWLTSQTKSNRVQLNNDLGVANIESQLMEKGYIKK